MKEKASFFSLDSRSGKSKNLDKTGHNKYGGQHRHQFTFWLSYFQATCDREVVACFKVDKSSSILMNNISMKLLSDRLSSVIIRSTESSIISDNIATTPLSSLSSLSSARKRHPETFDSPPIAFTKKPSKIFRQSPRKKVVEPSRMFRHFLLAQHLP